MQGARCGVQGARCRVRGAWCWVQYAKKPPIWGVGGWKVDWLIILAQIQVHSHDAS